MISALENPLIELADRAELAGRGPEAKRALRRALVEDPRSLQAVLRMASLLGAEGDRAGAARFLGRAERLGAPKAAPRQWFSALMKAGRYSQAFKAAERLLDSEPGEAGRIFWQPWERVLAAARRRGDVDVLGRLCASRGRGAIWARYFRACLREDGDAAADHERLARLPRRYAWMSLRAGHEHLNAGRFQEAAACLERAARGGGRDWKAWGHLAEALACLGRDGAARRALRRARAEAPPFERREADAWRGELELWLGRYAAALRLLERSARAGAQNAHCWAAAAKFKLGRVEAALADVERVIGLFPQDQEARLWRAEMLRARGRPAEALKALEGHPGRVWPLVNKALAFHECGRAAGMRRAFGRLPEGLRLNLRGRLALKGPWSDASRLRALRLALRLAKGYRREDHMQAVWMSR